MAIVAADMADSQNTPQRKTRDTKATRPSPMPGLSEAEFEDRVKAEPDNPVLARLAKKHNETKEG